MISYVEKVSFLSTLSFIICMFHIFLLFTLHSVWFFCFFCESYLSSGPVVRVGQCFFACVEQVQPNVFSLFSFLPSTKIVNVCDSCFGGFFIIWDGFVCVCVLQCVFLLFVWCDFFQQRNGYVLVFVVFVRTQRLEQNSK